MDDTILRVDDIQKFYGNKGNLTIFLSLCVKVSFSVLWVLPALGKPLC